MKQRREKGNGSIRQRKNGTWEGRYVDSMGNRKSVYGKTRKDVKNRLEILCYTRNITKLHSLGGDVTMDIWFEHYINAKRMFLKEQSADQIELAYKTHIQPLIGNMRLCNITPSDVLAVLDSLKNKDLKQTTQRNVYTHLKTMFGFAKDEGILTHDPTVIVHPTFDVSCDRRALTNSEINIVLQYLKNRDYQFYIMVSMMLYTGMRAGELSALRWNDVDFVNNTITVNESRTSNKYNGTTKTKSSVRKIPLNSFLTGELREKRRTIGERYDPDEYIFLNRFGKAFGSAYVGMRFKKLKTEIENKHHIDLAGITPHCLRHTFATTGISSGVDIVTMKDLLGHSNSNMLLDVYAHANAAIKHDSVERISESYGTYERFE